jgi:hypothetical protein
VTSRKEKKVSAPLLLLWEKFKFIAEAHQVEGKLRALDGMFIID